MLTGFCFKAVPFIQPAMKTKRFLGIGALVVLLLLAASFWGSMISKSINKTVIRADLVQIHSELLKHFKTHDFQ